MSSLATKATPEATSLEADVRARLERILMERYGRVDEELVHSGLLDSLRAIELALALEAEFQVPLEDFAGRDLGDISSLVAKIVDRLSQRQP